MKLLSERYAGKACVVNDVLLVFDAETTEGSVACWSDPNRTDAAPTELREEDIAVCRAMPKHFEIVEDGAGAGDETETASDETDEAADGAEEAVAETAAAEEVAVEAEAKTEEKPATKKAAASKKQPAAK